MISAWVSITLAPQSLEIEVALVSSSNCNFLMSLSEALPTTAITLCRNLHAEALQATVSEGLAQGPYVAARAVFKPSGRKASTLPMRN